MKKHIVRLSVEERTQLTKMTNSGRGSARTFARAHILLKADQSDQGPAWSDEQISKAFNVTIQTVERVRRQLVEDGFAATLSRHEFHLKIPRRKIDGDLEARLVTLACSQAPEGRSRWTLRLLAESLVELNFIQGISYETVRRTLKKTKLSLG